jgi:hypothetical protein
MASAWGVSWGNAWGNSWGAITTATEPLPTSGAAGAPYYDDKYWERKRKERDDELDAIIRSSFESIITAEEPPKSKLKKKARKVFQKFVVEEKVDFAALEAAAQANKKLLEVYKSLIQAIEEQIQQERLYQQYEDDFVLLMLASVTVSLIKFH